MKVKRRKCQSRAAFEHQEHKNHETKTLKLLKILLTLVQSSIQMVVATENYTGGWDPEAWKLSKVIRSRDGSSETVAKVIHTLIFQILCTDEKAGQGRRLLRKKKWIHFKYGRGGQLYRYSGPPEKRTWNVTGGKNDKTRAVLLRAHHEKAGREEDPIWNGLIASKKP